MDTDLFLLRLEDQITKQSGPIIVDKDKLKEILAHIKNLERCLADVLRMMHAGRKTPSPATRRAS